MDHFPIKAFSSFLISQISQKMALDLFPLGLIQWIPYRDCGLAFLLEETVLEQLLKPDWLRRGGISKTFIQNLVLLTGRMGVVQKWKKLDHAPRWAGGCSPTKTDQEVWFTFHWSATSIMANPECHVKPRNFLGLP